MNENLSTLSLDVEKGELKVNGKDMSDVSYFKLEFNGAWSLTISEDFYVNGKKGHLKIQVIRSRDKF